VLGLWAGDGPALPSAETGASLNSGLDGGDQLSTLPSRWSRVAPTPLDVADLWARARRSLNDWSIVRRTDRRLPVDANVDGSYENFSSDAVPDEPPSVARTPVIRDFVLERASEKKDFGKCVNGKKLTNKLTLICRGLGFRLYVTVGSKSITVFINQFPKPMRLNNNPSLKFELAYQSGDPRRVFRFLSSSVLPLHSLRQSWN